MAHHTREQPDFVPHLPDLLISMGQCWRTLRDTQTEVDPFGLNFAALEEAVVTLDALAHQLTGQRGFFTLADIPRPQGRHAPSMRDGEPF